MSAESRPDTIRKWTVDGWEYVLENPWIAVREENCRTADGMPLGHYYVLEYPAWVHMVVLDDDNRLLVTRQYRPGLKVINREIPCGCAWPQDRSVEDAARRELLEETGYDGRFEPVAAFSPNAATHSNIVHTFLVTQPRRVAEPEDNPHEPMDFEFLPLPDVMALIDQGEFRQALHVAGVFSALRKAGLFQLMER